MVDKRRIATIGATLLIAAATGHVMQNGFAFAAKTSSPVAKSVPILDENSKSEILGALPKPPHDMIVSASFQDPDNAIERRVYDVAMAPPTGAVLTDVPAPLFSRSTCEPILSLTAQTGAQVLLEVDAPCHQNSRIVISHGKMEFADATEPTGTYRAIIPVLGQDASFTITFADGETAKASASEFDVFGYKRVAVSWGGGPGLHIHALEFGSNYGDVGHIWAEADGSVGSAKGGFLVQMGNPDVLDPMLAEIYSLPTESIHQDGAVRLIVEAEVNDLTCGSTLAGKTHQISESGEVSSTSISLAMPDCNDAGGFLVLKNLLQDLKIASN